MIQNKKRYYLTAGLVAGIILLLSIILIVMPKQSFSENENRYLAKWPVLSWENVKSGEYMTGVNTWLSDHFPFRNFFMGLKTDIEISFGKREINNVYIADDDYLIEAYDIPLNTERIANTFNKFYQKVNTAGIDTHLMLVPTAHYILSDKLPQNAPKINQMDTANSIYKKSEIPFIDCTDYLMSAADTGQVYYYTDHHWTTYGAYQGYLAFCESKGFEPVSLDDMYSEVVTNKFYGTIYSKVNDYNHKSDFITIYKNENDVLTVNYTDTGAISDTLYNLDYVSQKDKYSLFLDNLHTLIEITNEASETDRELVLIKDSYANCMVPFLAHHYKKIYVFDTRYYKQGPASFVKEHSTITDILILYNMNTLDTDSGIRGIY